MRTPNDICTYPNQNAKFKKQVRFSEYSSMTLIPPCQSNDLWYREEDKKGFKQCVAETIYGLRNEGVTSDVEQLAIYPASDNYHAKTIINLTDRVVGVEHMISCSVFKLNYLRRMQVITRVLCEQANQKASGMANEHRLAQISEQNSFFAKEWALTIASLRLD